MDCKYALLALPHIGQFPELTQNHTVHDSTLLLVDPQSILSTISDTVWKSWLGELNWDALFETEHVFVSYCPTQTPEILDGENKKLTDFLVRSVYHGLLLLGPFSGSGGKIHLLSGHGKIVDGKVIIQDIRSYSTLDKWIAPGFRMNKQYWRWMKKEYTEEGVINELRRLIALTNGMPETEKDFLFRLALNVFRLGVSDRWPDIVFPHMVRAIETLVAIPKTGLLKKKYGEKHSSAKEFSRRVLKYYPVQKNHLYNYEDTQLATILEDIYQLRSDSVHGKPLAWTLKQSNPDMTQNDFYILEYISQVAARALLVEAMSNPKFAPFLGDRAMLEAAWLEDKI